VCTCDGVFCPGCVAEHATAALAVRMSERGNVPLVISQPERDDANLSKQSGWAILARLGHSERIGNGLYKNIPGRFDLRLFESLVRYYA
jgi:hypothetical protein